MSLLNMRRDHQNSYRQNSFTTLFRTTSNKKMSQIRVEFLVKVQFLIHFAKYGLKNLKQAIYHLNDKLHPGVIFDRWRYCQDHHKARSFFNKMEIAKKLSLTQQIILEHIRIGIEIFQIGTSRVK